MPFTHPTATPGVYVLEGPPRGAPIEGVATSVVAFIGLAPAGPINAPTKVTSLMDFERTFGKGQENGPYMEGAYLAHSVRGFFLNGGTVAYIVRVGPNTYPGRLMKELPSAVEHVPVPYVIALKPDSDLERLTSVQVVVEADQAPAGESGATAPADDSSDAAPKPSFPPPAPTFTVTVTPDAGDPETFGPGLTTTPGHNSIATRVTTESKLVDIILAGGEFASAELVPAAGSYDLAPAPSPVPPTDAAAVSGEASRMTGLTSLALAEEVTTVCAPDLWAMSQDPAVISEVQGEIIKFCADSRRMAIIDPPPALNGQEISTWHDDNGLPASEFATVYWPWIDVADAAPRSKKGIHVPPCGHVAGAWAGTDALRGVHKAPAGVALTGVMDLGFNITDPGQEALNAKGINCIRKFPGRGTLIWGARTLNVDSEWKYINVRRLFNYLMASILRATNWAVFEPNDEVLWGQLTVSVSNFLTRTWRTGALVGATPDEAFFVKCDAETNPQDLIDAGQVTVLIGVAPVEPAEFVFFEISQFHPGV